jgi:hypothetical protein
MPGCLTLVPPSPRSQEKLGDDCVQVSADAPSADTRTTASATPPSPPLFSVPVRRPDKAE